MREQLRHLGYSLLLLALAVTPELAWAGGAMFGRSGTISTSQLHVAIVLEENLTTLVMQVGVEGGVGDLAWVISTTGLAPALLTPTTPEYGPPDAFARLHEATAARLVSFGEKRRDLGCTEVPRLAEVSTAPPAWAAYSVGSRSLRAFDRAASDAVVPWLTGRGYQVDAEAAALLEAEAAADRFFAVVELGGVQPLGDGADHSTAASPLMLVLRGDQRVIPLALSRLNAVAPMEVVLYVIGRGRHEVTTFANTELKIASWLDDEDLDAWYEGELVRTFAEQEEPTFVVEHADFIPLAQVQYLLRREQSVASLGAVDWFVTRLRARLQPDELAADAEVKLWTGNPEQQRLRVRVVEAGEPERAASPGWVLLLPAAALWRARRRGRR